MIRLIIFILIFQILSACSNNNKPISTLFIALGDLPSDEKNYPLYEALIKSINLIKPSLVIHTGDATHPGDCTNKTIDHGYNYMNSFDAPVLFALGDNDWTDCPKRDYDSIERLNYYRQTHFNSNITLGSKSIEVFNQNETGHPENMRLSKDNIGFVTVHVIRTINNMIPLEPDLREEFFLRNEANLLWLKQSFSEFNDTDAIVVTLHANMFESQRLPFKMLAHKIYKNKKLLLSYETYKTLFRTLFGGPNYKFKLPYRDIGKSIQKLSSEFKKPVLLLHGDTHFHRITRPLKDFPYLHVIETFGSPNVKAIEIAVQPKSKNPFKVKKIINPH